MTNNRPVLLPILRSQTQARLLAALLLNPGREASLSELASEIGVNGGNLHGDVERLVKAGVLADRRVGRTRLIRDAGREYSKPLADLLLLAYGPRPLLEEALRDIDGITTRTAETSATRRRAERRAVHPPEILRRHELATPRLPAL